MNHIYTQKDKINLLNTNNLRQHFHYHADQYRLRGVTIYVMSELIDSSTNKTTYRLQLCTKKTGEYEVPFEIQVDYVRSNSPKMKRAKGAELGRKIVDFISSNLSSYLDYE